VQDYLSVQSWAKQRVCKSGCLLLPKFFEKDVKKRHQVLNPFHDSDAPSEDNRQPRQGSEQSKGGAGMRAV
jgi:hypothetical protein